MTQLVALQHPLTGETLHMHPDIALQTHRWVHPDPCVPTPTASLPLFDLHALDREFSDLARAQHPHSTPDAAAIAELEPN